MNVKQILETECCGNNLHFCSKQQLIEAHEAELKAAFISGLTSTTHDHEKAWEIYRNEQH